MTPKRLVIYPTVTQVLDWHYGEWKNHVPKDALEKARKWGVDRHKMIADALRGGERNEYVAPVLHWLDTYRAQLGDVRAIEMRIISDTLGLSGQPDLVTEYALIDWKRTVDKKLAQLQLAGYSLLLEEQGIKVDAWIVYDLQSNRAHNVTDKRAVKKFVKLLQEYKEVAYEF